MKVLIGNINIRNHHMLLELAGIAGFAGSVEYTSEILKMLEAFVENKFSIKLV
ncbi:TPA: hypothetical protein ACWAKR_005498 [Escherichia coli]